MADEENAEARQTESGSRWRTWFTFKWVMTPLGLLKIAEFVVLLLGLIIMAAVERVGTISEIEFFIFVHTTAWVFVLVVIILHTLNVYQRLPGIITSNITMLTCCALAGLVLMICSAVVMGKYSWHGTVLAAGSFGLISMFFFLFEAVYYFLKFRQDGPMPSHQQQSSKPTQEDEFSSQPPDYY